MSLGAAGVRIAESGHKHAIQALLWLLSFEYSTFCTNLNKNDVFIISMTEMGRLITFESM